MFLMAAVGDTLGEPIVNMAIHFGVHTEMYSEPSPSDNNSYIFFAAHVKTGLHLVEMYKLTTFLNNFISICG